MRKIIFRGKRSDANEWVYGDLIHGVGSKHGFIYILPITHIYPKGCNELDGWNVIPETVGQFTGLTGKNGKEIYEGDIVRIHEGRNDFKITSIVWSDEFLCYEPSNKDLRHALKSRYSEYYEIIGNIHDNPSLLTNKE